MKKYEAIGMLFYRKKLRMPLTKHVSDDKILEKMKIKSTLILNIRTEIEIYWTINVEKRTWKILYLQDMLK